MIGRRLTTAKRLAEKRARRYPEWEGETGRLRKERVLCNCSMCKASRRKRKKEKGFVKMKQTERDRAQ